jgi:hypothetical protein
MPPHLETGYLEAMALAVREELNHERRACAVCAPGKRPSILESMDGRMGRP